MVQVFQSLDDTSIFRWTIIMGGRVNIDKFTNIYQTNDEKFTELWKAGFINLLNETYLPLSHSFTNWCFSWTKFTQFTYIYPN